MSLVAVELLFIKAYAHVWVCCDSSKILPCLGRYTSLAQNSPAIDMCTYCNHSSFSFYVHSFIQYNSTSLERGHKHDLLTEVDLGVPIDLILPETYTNTDQTGTCACMFVYWCLYLYSWYNHARNFFTWTIISRLICYCHFRPRMIFFMLCVVVAFMCIYLLWWFRNFEFIGWGSSRRRSCSTAWI